MKNFIVLLFILFSIASVAQTNASYYWSGKRKIFLTPDSASWSLIASKSSSKKMATLKISSEAIVSNLRLSESSELVDFTLREYSKKAIKQLKQKLIGHGEITCHHLVEGKTPIILTGEILLQPKKSVSVSSILGLIKLKAKQVKATEYNTFVLKAENIEETITLANQIYESGLVDWCHPDFWVEIQRTTADPLYNQQYYLNQANNIDINAPEAFAITQGCNNVRVAVIDDGVENHEDINGRVLQGFTARNANGFGAPVANLPPANLLTIIGHGQACAGIIGATQDNNLGIGGIAPNSRIVPVNIFSDWFIFTDGSGNQSVRFRETSQDLAASINWAWNANQGNADVISNSWGFNSTNGPGGIDSDAIRQAITNARTQGRNRNGAVRGCIVVFASGNSNIRTGCSTSDGCFDGVSFPANVNGVITVGAIDRNGNIWDYSSRGAEMDLVAPSGGPQGDLVTTDRMGANGYDAGNYTTTFNGTSAACPQVSGVAALMISVNPNLTEAQVTTILQQTATDMGATGFDNTFGFGRLNADAALRRVIADLGISLTGSNLICTNSSSQFTLNNPPAGSTVTWSSSNPSGISFSSTTGIVTTPTRINNFNGQATIIATVALACGSFNVTRNVAVGSGITDPLFEQKTVLCPPGTGFYQVDARVTMPANSNNVTYTYRWYIDNVLKRTITNNNFASVPGGNIDNLFHKLRVDISNTCGSISTANQEGRFRASCGSGGGGQLRTFPNPASDQLTVELVDATMEEEAQFRSTGKSNLIVVPLTIKLFDSQGMLRKSIKGESGTVIVDTSDLPNGIYYMHAENQMGRLTSQIIVKH